MLLYFIIIMACTTENRMYKLQPYYNSSDVVDTPDCMYKLKRIYGDNKTKDEMSESVPPEIAVLEHRQTAILQRLEALKAEVEKLSVSQSATSPAAATLQASIQAPGSSLAVNGVIQDVVINASPLSPPLSLLVLYELLSPQYKVLASSYVHSSVTQISDNLRNVFSTSGQVISRTNYQLALSLIWKNDKLGTSMMLSPNIQTAVLGEANIARYLARLINPAYDSTNITKATEIDTWLDRATDIITGSKKEKAAVLRTLNAKLGTCSWLVGSELTLADVVVWSALQQNKMTQAVPGNVKKWLEACNQQAAFTSALAVANQL